MNDELLKIVDWLTANKLSLNVKKTNFIIFHPYQKHLNYDVILKFLITLLIDILTFNVKNMSNI